MERYVVPMIGSGVILIATGRTEEGLAVICSILFVAAFNGILDFIGQ